MVSLTDFKLPSTVILLSSLLYQNGIVFLTCVGLLTIFCLLRPNNGAVYHRRRKLADSNKAFPKLPSDFLSWVLVVWRTSEEEILQRCGLDAVMLLRLVRLGIGYALCMVPFGIALVGVNYFAAIDIQSKESLGFDLQRLTITNVNKKSLIWVHIIFSWVSFLILGIWMYKNNMHFLKLRKAYFSSEEYQSDLSSRTLIFYHLPRRCRDAYGVKEFLSGLPPRFQSGNISLAKNVAHLPSLVQEFNFIVRQLERAISNFVDKEGRQIGPRPMHRLKGSGINPFGKKVDSIQFYSSKAQETFNEIQEVRDYAVNLPSLQVGFVTFENAYVAHSVLQALLPGVGSQMRGYKPLPEVKLAPKPRDIIWSNLSMSRREIRWRTIIFTALFVIVLIGGAFPLALLGTFANVAGIRKLFNNDQLFQGGISKALIEGTFSPLIMILSMVMVRILMRKLSINQSAMTHSLVDRRLLAKYYTFLLFNHLIVFSTLQTLPTAIGAFSGLEFKGAGEFLGAIKDIIPQVGTHFTKAIIQTSSFWINQMALRTIGYFFELIQVVTLSRRFLQKHFLRLSPRDLSEATQPQAFEYPIAYALQCFHITILLLFSISSPLIIPFGLFNLAVSFFVYKHQIMFVYQTKVETGGRLWITAFKHLITAIILSQFFLLLVFLLSGVNDTQWRVILPLPFLTVVLALSHQTWILSRFELIDWREKAPHPYPNAPHYASLDGDFHHPVFEEELLVPQLSHTVLAAVPEVLRLNFLLGAPHRTLSDVSRAKRRGPGAHARDFDEASLNDACSERGSLIELIDRSSTYED